MKFLDFNFSRAPGSLGLARRIFGETRTRAFAKEQFSRHRQTAGIADAVRYSSTKVEFQGVKIYLKRADTGSCIENSCAKHALHFFWRFFDPLDFGFDRTNRSRIVPKIFEKISDLGRPPIGEL